MKKKLIQKISEFFKRNSIGYIDLVGLERNFKSTNQDGTIEIIFLKEASFVYKPFGHLDEIEGEYELLSINDLKEISYILEAFENN